MTYDRYRTRPEGRFDAVVVGSGIGGLVAAALLSRHGRRVLLIEQHSIPGGNATVFRRGAYQFDIGLHYVGGCQTGGLLDRILAEAGVSGIEFEELDPDGFDTLVYPDLTFRIPKGIENYHQRLLEFFPSERRGIDRWIKLLYQIQGVQGSIGRPLQLLRRAPRSLLLSRWAGTTLAEFLDSCTSDRQLRAILAGQHGDYALPPSRASVAMAAGLALHYLDGAYFPKGGGHILSNGLAAAIENQGGRLLLMTRATRIVVRQGSVEAVEAESRHLGKMVIPTRAVISNADIKQTFLRLLDRPDVSPETIERTRSFEMAPALGILCLGYARDLRAEGAAATNYWVYPTYDYESQYAATVRGEFVHNPFAYLTIASLKDPDNPKLAPVGVSNLQVMSLAPHRPEAWGVTDDELRDGTYRQARTYLDCKERYARSLIRTAQRVFPDLDERLAFRELATPLSHHRFTASSGGTGYGIAATPAQFLRHRPGARTEIEGLLLCGASTRSGHGIGGAAMSGLFAAATLLGRRSFVGEVLESSTRSS